MKRDVLAYISGPITAAHGRTVEQNVANAAALYFECIRRGIPAVCVHLGAIFPSAHGIDYEDWMRLDFALLDRCTHLIAMPTWKQSSGAVREMEYALCRSMPIAYSVDELAEMVGSDA